MAEPMPVLLAEQERLMPLLERLLGLAALWVDPPVPGGEGAGAGLQFATDPAAALALPSVARAASAVGTAVAAGGPGLAALSPRPIGAAGPGTHGRSPVVGARTEGVARAEAATPSAQGLVPPPAAGLSSASGAALPPALPIASLGRLRERAGARLGTPGRSAAFRSSAASGVAATPFAALAAAAAAPFDPGTPSAAAAMPWMPVGAAGVMEAAPPPSTTAPTTAAAPAGRPAGSLAAWAAAAAVTNSPGLPGDALEERLADILERAAAEAGISLP